MEIQEPLEQPTTNERLPWHKPEVQRLSVNIDTGSLKTGSFVDGTSGAPTPTI